MVVSLLHVPIMLSMHVLFVLGRRPRTREPVNPHHLSSKGGTERESEKERTFLYVCVYIYMVLRNEYIILYYDESVKMKSAHARLREKDFAQYVARDRMHPAVNHPMSHLNMVFLARV